MTEVLLIRHGETGWNAIKRLQGHLDVPLNAEGLRQAAALGRILRDERFDAIISSDLSRARQTAEAIAAPQGMPLQIERGLRERCYGAFEGMLYADIAGRYPQAYADWKARELDARFPPGVHVAETLREFFTRAVTTIERLLSLSRYRKVALVTHGGVLECAYRAAEGSSLERERDFDIFNASINRFVWADNALKLVEWGNIVHLRQADSLVLDEIDR